MKLKARDRVKHQNKPEWGIGEVMEDCQENKIEVFFVNQGQKTLSQEHVTLIKLEGKEGVHPLLDNLSIPSKEERNVKFQSLQGAIIKFLKFFPEGFFDPEYLKRERDYKVEAHLYLLDNRPAA